jgi:hypothetical protein
MTRDELFTLIRMILTMLSLTVGAALLLIGGLVLMSVKFLMIGGPLFLGGALALWFAVDHL